MGRGLDSQVPSTSTLNITTNLVNHLTGASGDADQLLIGPTRQVAWRVETTTRGQDNLVSMSVESQSQGFYRLSQDGW